MTKEITYIIFPPIEDKKIKNYIERWVEDSGGSICIEELKKRFEARFRYFIAPIFKESEIKKMQFFKSHDFRDGNIYRIENGIVYKKCF